MRASLIIAAVLLGGCQQSSVEEKNASVEDVARAVAGSSAASRFTPGRWETRITVTGIDAPGLPPEAAAGVKQAIAKAQVIATCLTPAQAANPEANFFNRDVKNCRYDHFRMGDGKIDAALTCSAPGGAGQSSVTMKGTFDPTSYAMTMTTSATSGPAGAMTINMAMTATHAGTCRGDETKA